MSRTLCALVTNDSGVTLIEYGFIALFIAMVAVVALGAIGGSLQNIFANVSASF